jgi:drug/metabolite transporter (DMT)-like permease
MQTSSGKERTPFHPPTILVIGILAASTSSVFIRFAQEEVPSLVIASYRLSLATLILLPYTISRYRADISRLNGQQWAQIITAGIFLGAHFGTWISSLEFTSVTSSVILVQTTPLFVMLLSPILLREGSSIWTYLGLSLAIIGSIGIALSDSCSLPIEAACLRELTHLNSTAMRGDLLALAGALSGAVYLIIGRATRKAMQLIPYITLIYAVAAITLIGVAALSGHTFSGYSPKMYMWFLLLALFPQLLAHSSYNWALKYLPATSVSLSLLGEPVSAAFLAYLILDEALPALRWISAVVVLAGIALAFYRPKSTLRGISKIDKIQG